MWWNKPLDVGEPEKLSLDATLTGEDLLNCSKLLAAMCVQSKLDNSRTEYANLEESLKAFVFPVDYKYLEKTDAFGGTINHNTWAKSIEYPGETNIDNLVAAFGGYIEVSRSASRWKEWVPPDDLDQVDISPKPERYRLYSLIYPPLMQKYALRKNKYVLMVLLSLTV